MRGNTHEIVGINAGILATAAILKATDTSNTAAIGILIGSCIGCLLPDADIVYSKTGKMLFFISYPLKWISKLFAMIHRRTGSKGAAGVNVMCGHRGILHTPFFWGLLSFLLYVAVHFGCEDTDFRRVLFYLITGVGVGALSHIVADMLNPTGVPILFPFSCRKVSIGNISTGSSKETVFNLLSLAISVLFVSVGVLNSLL